MVKEIDEVCAEGGPGAAAAHERVERGGVAGFGFEGESSELVGGVELVEVEDEGADGDAEVGLAAGFTRCR